MIYASMALSKCPECGGKVSDKAKQCPHCGCPIDQPQKQSKTCPECGQEVDASVMVCPNCALPFSRIKTNGKVDKHSNTTNTDNQNGKRIVDRNQSECPLCKSIIYESDERCPVCGITAHLRDLIKRAAEDATAANELGRSYELGNEIMMDYSKALYWYKQAAKKGNVDGMVNLARLYAGWNEDTIKAKQWCDEAVRNGREDAYTQVGNELKKRGQDKKAICWYNKDLGFEIQKQREQKEARKKRKENRKQSNGRLKPSIYAITVSLVCVIVYFCFFNDPSLKNCEPSDLSECIIDKYGDKSNEMAEYNLLMAQIPTTQGEEIYYELGKWYEKMSDFCKRIGAEQSALTYSNDSQEYLNIDASKWGKCTSCGKQCSRDGQAIRTKSSVIYKDSYTECASCQIKFMDRSDQKFWHDAIKDARSKWVDNNPSEARRRGIEKF